MMKLRPHTVTALLLGTLAATSACAPPDPAAAAAGVESSRYAAVARGRIDIEGGMLPLSAARAGVAASVLAHPGDHVKRGQPLVRLQADDARTAVSIASGQLRQAHAQTRLLDVRLKGARQHAKRLAAAAAAGAGAAQNAADATQNVEQINAEKASAEAAVQIAKGRLELARHALAQHTLTAPMAADVVEVAVQAGEAVAPQSAPMLTLLPDSPRLIVAELNSDFADAVRAGMSAQVLLDDDTERLAGGAHVARMGKVFGPSMLENDPALRANTRTVTCVLHFDAPSSLRIGQRVLVRILRDAHVNPPSPGGTGADGGAKAD